MANAHLEDLYGLRVSPDLISRVTDAVLDEVREWQHRALDRMYPIVIFDALRVKIRDADSRMVKNKAVTSPWASPGKGIARFWALDRRQRGCQVLAVGDERTAQPHSPWCLNQWRTMAHSRTS